MKNKKGFTLIELLAVVVILVILISLAVPAVSRYLTKGTIKYYNSLEDNLVLAGREYLNDYPTLYPKEIENVTVIELNELTGNKYIDEIVDSNGNKCDAQVTIKKVNKNKYEYYTCLICDDYQTKEENCGFSEEDNVTTETKNYSIGGVNDKYIVAQGESFTLPVAKAYYLGELVDSNVVGNPRIIDTNKLGKTTVTYSYKGQKKQITVEVIDKVAPSVPQIVLKYDNSKGKSYNGNWYSGGIYSEFKSTDYTKQGLTGSGISYYEISTDQKTWQKITGNSYVLSTNGNITYYVRSIDKSGNVSASNSFSVKIDKEKPQCSLTSIGTTGNGSWYTDNATVSFKTATDGVSSIKSQTIDSPNITSDVKNKVVTGTVIDQAGNIGTCTIKVSVDKTNPKVSYSVAGGIYNSNKNVTVTASDAFYSHMNIQVNKNNTVNNQDNNITSKTKTYTLTDGSWTIYTKTYDESGRKQSQSPENEYGWYYQNYIIDTKAPTCSLKVTSGTAGSNGWYVSNVTVGFNTTDGTGSNIVLSSFSATSLSSSGTITGTVTDQAGNVGTCSISVKIEKSVTTPTITYNGGSNSCSWKNNYNLTLSSSAVSGIAYYEMDVDNNGTADATTGSNFIPSNGFSSCTVRFRAVSNAGNKGAWTANQHIHMDTEKPKHTNWWWGTVTKDNAPLYIQVSDNVGISKVQCPTSTASGSYNNWYWFNAVWDSSANAYRCDITPSTFGHYNQTYITHLYIYDHAGNGGYYNQTSVAIPATCPYNLGQAWGFDYTGGTQEFVIPCGGTYKLEVWGAQGGSTNVATGGQGGYASGNISLTTSTKLYVVVGGQGASLTIPSSGGYNGGGNGLCVASKCYAAAGGGATHIGNFNSTLSWHNSTNGLYIVAGGGGGAGNSNTSFSAVGGAGGGEQGGNGGDELGANNNGDAISGLGGTQTGNYSRLCSIDSDHTHDENGVDIGWNMCGGFGYGGTSGNNLNSGSGGGGGLYGGTSGTNYNGSKGGGGGSGYIGGVTNGSMQNGVRKGSGYAKITLVSID